MTSRRAALLALALPARAAAAQDGLPDAAALAERMAKRFPQDVRVGALTGRDVLQPTEAQTVLGHVAAVARRPDGGAVIFVRLAGWLGLLSGRTVAVPAEAMAWLGPQVALLDYTPDQLRALPTAAPPADALGPDAVIRMGLTRPFH